MPWEAMSLVEFEAVHHEQIGRRHAAVDDQRMAVDVGGGGRGEEEGGAGDLRRIGPALGGAALALAFAGRRGDQLGVGLGGEEAGRQGIRRDAGGAELGRQRARERRQPALGRDIGEAPGTARSATIEVTRISRPQRRSIMPGTTSLTRAWAALRSTSIRRAKSSGVDVGEGPAVALADIVDQDVDRPRRRPPRPPSRRGRPSRRPAHRRQSLPGAAPPAGARSAPGCGHAAAPGRRPRPGPWPSPSRGRGRSR